MVYAAALCVICLAWASHATVQLGDADSEFDETLTIVALSDLPHDVRRRTAHYPPEVQAIRAVQDSLDALDESLHDARHALHNDYANKRLAAARHRNLVLARLPGFWGEALAHCPGLHGAIHDSDAPILQHIVDLDISAVRGDVKVSVVLSPNAFIDADEALWVDITVTDAGEVVPTHSGVPWIAGRRPEGGSFFNIFEANGVGAETLYAAVHALQHEAFLHPSYFQHAARLDALDTADPNAM